MSSGKKIIKTVLFALGAALVLPLIFGGGPTKGTREGESSWRTFIFEFQTLIAGGLAVGAAWWTVKTMENTDVAAANRHAEQMDLVLRKDKLSVERAVNPQILALESTAYHWNELRANMLKENTYYGQLAYIVANAWILHDLSSSLAKLLQTDQVKEGSKLFDGILTYKLVWLHERAEEIASFSSHFPEKLFGYQIDDALNDQSTYKHAGIVYGAISKVSNEIPVVAGLMRATAKRYGVSYSSWAGT